MPILVQLQIQKCRNLLKKLWSLALFLGKISKFAHHFSLDFDLINSYFSFINCLYQNHLQNLITFLDYSNKIKRTTRSNFIWEFALIFSWKSWNLGTGVASPKWNELGVYSMDWSMVIVILPRSHFFVWTFNFILGFH